MINVYVYTLPIVALYMYMHKGRGSTELGVMERCGNATIERCDSGSCDCWSSLIITY